MFSVLMDQSGKVRWEQLSSAYMELPYYNLDNAINSSDKSK